MTSRIFLIILVMAAVFMVVYACATPDLKFINTHEVTVTRTHKAPRFKETYAVEKCSVGGFVCSISGAGQTAVCRKK